MEENHTMMKRYRFQFPPNKRASATLRRAQAAKIVEEAAEAYAAVLDGEQALRIAEEAFDAITAAEGLLRKYPESVREAAYRLIIEKGNRRGDWSE